MSRRCLWSSHTHMHRYTMHKRMQIRLNSVPLHSSPPPRFVIEFRFTKKIKIWWRSWSGNKCEMASKRLFGFRLNIRKGSTCYSSSANVELEIKKNLICQLMKNTIIMQTVSHFSDLEREAAELTYFPYLKVKPSTFIQSQSTSYGFFHGLLLKSRTIEKWVLPMASEFTIRRRKRRRTKVFLGIFSQSWLWESELVCLVDKHPTTRLMLEFFEKILSPSQGSYSCFPDCFHSKYIRDLLKLKKTHNGFASRIKNFAGKSLSSCLKNGKKIFSISSFSLE